jgi:hypothetical protein
LNLGNNFNPARNQQYNGEGLPLSTKMAPFPGVLQAKSIARMLI